jgi:protein O-mannosyl-transferase
MPGATSTAAEPAASGARASSSAPPAAPGWATPRGAAVIVALVTAVAFARSLGNAFTYDEGLVILGAQRFLQSGSFSTLFTRRYFAASLEGTWRPVCTFTYMVDAMIALAPAVFKAQSLAWHILAAWLVMALARRLLPERQRRWAVVAGLVFALHPVTTEVVDNASFREDSLVTVFTLATLLLALDGRRRLALLAFALGLLSKESAVMAPALLAVLRLGRLDGSPPQPRRARIGRTVRELSPFAAVVVGYLAIRFGPMNSPGRYARYPGGTFAGTLIGVPAIWAHDLRLLVWPWPLCADYTGYFRFGAQPWGPVVGSALVVAGYVVGVGIAWRAGERLIAFGLGWFLFVLLPVSNLLPIPIPAAERFLYLPLVGIGLAAAALYARIAERRPGARAALAAGGILALGALVVVANLRHGQWRDDESLWSATVAVNPRSCGAESAVGGGLLSRGMASRDPETLRASAAREELALSLCADADDPARAAMVYARLGAARALLGENTAAQAALERSISLLPAYALPVAWLGYVDYRQGDLDGAAALLKRAIIDLGPPDATVAAVAELYVDKI